MPEPSDIAAVLPEILVDERTLDVWEVVSPYTIRCRRKTAATGLLWQVPAPDEKPRALARKLAMAGRSPDLLVRHASQIGFGTRRDGLRAGMPAAALLFDPARMGRNWLAVFKMPTSPASRIGGPVAWWLVAWRDGLVLSDRIWIDEAGCRRAFDDLADNPGWDRRICPEEWGLPETRQIGLADAIAPRRIERPLTSSNPVVTWLVRAALGLATGVMVAGIWVWIERREDEIRREIDAIQAQDEALREAALRQPPWTDAPAPLAGFAACRDAFVRLSLSPPGWIPGPLSCRPKDAGAMTATASWTSDDRPLPWLLAGLRGAGLPEPELDERQRRATLSLDVFVPEGPDRRRENPIDGHETQRRLIARFATLGVDARLLQPSARNTSGSRSGATAVAASWGRQDLTIRTLVDPEAHLRLVSDIPATMPAEFTWNPETGAWTLVISIYQPSGGRAPSRNP